MFHHLNTDEIHHFFGFKETNYLLQPLLCLEGTMISK